MHAHLLELGMGNAGERVGELGVDIRGGEVQLVLGCSVLLDGADDLARAQNMHSRS